METAGSLQVTMRKARLKPKLTSEWEPWNIATVDATTRALFIVFQSWQAVGTRGVQTLTSLHHMGRGGVVSDHTLNTL